MKVKNKDIEKVTGKQGVSVNDLQGLDAKKVLLMDADKLTANEMFINKPKTIEHIAQDLKKKHGLKEIFITTIADQKIIWRKIKRSEYREAMTQEYNAHPDLAYYDKQEFIASKVILYPENLEELLEDFAGISDIIATETMVKTGFGIAETESI